MARIGGIGGVFALLMAALVALGAIEASATTGDDEEVAFCAWGESTYVGMPGGTLTRPDDLQRLIYGADLADDGDGRLCGILMTMSSHPGDPEELDVYLVHDAAVSIDAATGAPLLELRMEWWDYTFMEGTLTGIERPDGAMTFDGTLYDVETGDPGYSFEDFTIVPAP